MRLAALLLIGMLGLPGCVTVGRPFDASYISQMKPGVTTKDEAIANLGQPSAFSNMPNGQQLLQWQYVHGSMFGASSTHAAILFDADGKMVRITHMYAQ